ncbi:MAG: GC-type dockerin domain-anchored protein, partial [Phycisphaerales bacterium]
DDDQANRARATRPNPVLFVTQVPKPEDFQRIGSTFGNHLPTMRAVGRGGDLMIIYPDGTIRNLTLEAGYGNDGFQGTNAIAVRQPTVHFSGTKAIFSMVVGAPADQYDYLDFHWQLYEVTGLEEGGTAAITKVPNQPENYNNVSPAYASDGRILFTSDRSRDGQLHLYPQLDEYESVPTVSGVWALDAATGDLELLTHSPSGAFNISLDSFGRLIFTKWDHLQRDQQNDEPYQGGTDYDTFNYDSEAVDSVRTNSDEEFFPEPRDEWIQFINTHPNYSGPLRGYTPNLVGQLMERFQPWRINQDGTEEETINHIGRHEMADYFAQSFNNDPSLIEFAAEDTIDDTNPNKVSNLFYSSEDPTHPGDFFAVNAPTFFTHGCGQLVSYTGHPDENGDDFRITSITHPDTANPDATPSPTHSGLYRNPLPLSDGTLLAVHTNATDIDENDGTISNPISRYDLRIKEIDTSGSFAIAGPSITGGINKSIQYYDPDTLVSYTGPLWELDPVEVVARPVPPMPIPVVPTQEAQAIANANSTVEALTRFLKDNNLALIVSRDVTTRDRHDEQQPFNLRVTNTTTQTRGDNGILYDISFMQLFQADQIRGLGDDPGRRVLAVPMHDAVDRMPATTGPIGSVQLGDDGSMAALVPSKRAMTWQLTDEAGEPVVRERYWLTFQPGEIRSCTSCHGLNTTDQAGNPPPTNVPAALTDLVNHLRTTGQLACSQADLTGDGILDFFDVSAFLTAFNTNDPIADFTNDGIWNFFDISAFLTSFNAGCP